MSQAGRSRLGRGWAWLPLLLAAAAGSAAGAEPAALPRVLTVEDSVDWALRNSPELAALRQQHGIAAAGVVIARTYPFNPVLENRVQHAGGPESAGITNRVPLEHIMVWEVEVRGQGQYRRRQATAALSRTDWDIARQEQLLGVRVARAFRTRLYQRKKLLLAEETVRFNERLVEDVGRLVNGGKLGPADLVVAQTEVADARAALAPAQAALATARSDLSRALGVVDEGYELDGSLETISPGWVEEPVVGAALTLRGDLRSRQAAVTEAEARLRLAVADRYGNPSVGPAFSYDPTRISMIGVQLNVPLPVANTHRGEILQREAELAQAHLELRNAEIGVRQDVHAALARLTIAQGRVTTYRRRLLPDLEGALADVQRLFQAGQPGVDLLRVIDVRRKLLRARDGYLDALAELNQAQADLAAAVGEPALAVRPDLVPVTFPGASPP